MTQRPCRGRHSLRRAPLTARPHPQPRTRKPPTHPVLFESLITQSLLPPVTNVPSTQPLLQGFCERPKTAQVLVSKTGDGLQGKSLLLLLLQWLHDQALNHFKVLSFFYPGILKVIYGPDLKLEWRMHGAGDAQPASTAALRASVTATLAGGAPQPPYRRDTWGWSRPSPATPQRARPATQWRAATPGRVDPRPRDTALSQSFPAPPAPPDRGKHSPPPPPSPAAGLRLGWAGLGLSALPRPPHPRPDPPRATPPDAAPAAPVGRGRPGPAPALPLGLPPRPGGEALAAHAQPPSPIQCGSRGWRTAAASPSGAGSGGRPGGAGAAGQRWGAVSAPGPQRPPLGRCGAVRRFGAGSRRFDIPALGRAASRPAAAAGALPAAPAPGRGTGGRLGRPALAAGSPQGTRGRGRRGHFFGGGGTAAWVNWDKERGRRGGHSDSGTFLCRERREAVLALYGQLGPAPLSAAVGVFTAGSPGRGRRRRTEKQPCKFPIAGGPVRRWGMPQTPRRWGRLSLFLPSNPLTIMISPERKSPVIWPGWWPKPLGQVGGVSFFPFFDAGSCLVASLLRTCEPFPEELRRGADVWEMLLVCSLILKISYPLWSFLVSFVFP